ncbi:MAG: hypothetical protein QM756_05320 [Polyangiaceae bacterium]
MRATNPPPGMFDAATYWRRFGTAAVSLLAGALVLWLSLHSVGSDWYISQTHADILFTSAWRFHQFPYFSFVFGGGAYFIQDPQSNLFSIANPLVVLTGPFVGLRLAEGVWGAVGCYGFIVWMRRHVSETAAQFGGLAWCTSLGVLWRVTVGNDMFLWHLGLPILLFLLENVVRTRTWQSGVALGLAVGVFLLGPTFHTFLYLFGPVLPLFGLAELIRVRPRPIELGRIALLLAGALALAVLIAIPKFVCWSKFPMGRPVPDPGVPSVSDAFNALYDYSRSSWDTMTMGPIVRRRRFFWGIEEAMVALPPPATLLLPLGVIAGLYLRKYRAQALFALLLVGLGFTICTSAGLWERFRELTGGSFRVAPRFLAITWFGMAMLATIGGDALFMRWRRASAPLSAFFFAGVIASPLWWTHSAGQVKLRAANDTVMPDVVNPFTMARTEFEMAFSFDSFNELVSFREDAPVRAYMDGRGLSNGFLIVGNPEDPKRWLARMPIPVVEGLQRSDTQVGHTRIKLRNIPPHGSVSVRVLEPAFGVDITTAPANARLSLDWQPQGLILTNLESTTLERVSLRAKVPISLAWFFTSAAALLGASIALGYRRLKCLPAALRRHSFSV